MLFTARLCTVTSRLPCHSTTPHDELPLYKVPAFSQLHFKMTKTLILLVALLTVVLSHPAFQHHFHKIVNSDKCLAACMNIVQESEQEISILKRANISGMDVFHVLFGKSVKIH